MNPYIYISIFLAYKISPSLIILTKIKEVHIASQVKVFISISLIFLRVKTKDYCHSCVYKIFISLIILIKIEKVHLALKK